MRRLFHCEDNFPIYKIAVIPDLMGDGFELIPLIPIDAEIVDSIKSGADSLKKIKNEIFTAHRIVDTENSSYLAHYIIEEVNHLIENNILIVKSIKS